MNNIYVFFLVTKQAVKPSIAEHDLRWFKGLFTWATGLVKEGLETSGVNQNYQAVLHWFLGSFYL